MPIKGLSDRVQFTRAGFLKLGTKQTNSRGQEFPEKSDHFVADFENPALVEQFHRVYGAEPKRIRIAFASNDPDSVFSNWYKLYGRTTGLQCKGDGERAQRRNDANVLVDVACPGPDRCDFARKRCKPVGTLTFFIDGLDGLHVFQTNTSSYNSIIALNSAIALLRTLRGERGIAGVWVELLLVPKMVQVEGKAQEIFVLHLHIPANPRTVGELESMFDRPLALTAPVSEPAGVEVDLPVEEIESVSELGDDDGVGGAGGAEGDSSAVETGMLTRADMLEALGAHCVEHGMDKKAVSLAIRQKCGVARFDDVADVQLWTALVELGVQVDDIPF